MSTFSIKELLASPLQALLEVNERFFEGSSRDVCLRTVNFMIYELQSKIVAPTLKPDDDPAVIAAHELQKFERLNELFFATKGFKINNEACFLQPLLQKKEGAAICLALLYMHVGNAIGLKLQLVHWPFHAVIKWTHEAKAKYVDLQQQGRILNEEEILALINTHRDQVKTLDLQQAFVQYLSYVILNFRQNRLSTKVLGVLDMILSVEPENMRFLSERALLKKELGMLKESLIDFKRYFSFVDPAKASPELLHNYEETNKSVRERAAQDVILPNATTTVPPQGDLTV